MPSRLSRILSRQSYKDKEAEAEAERNPTTAETSSPPPEYSQAPPDYDAENVLDPPNLSAGFSNLTLNTPTKDGFPTSEECTAHLKLIECFYRLRQKIGSSDGLFGINDKIVTESGIIQGNRTPELLAKLAEKRWAIYVTKAVDRFEAWWSAVLPGSKMARMSSLELEGAKGTLCEPRASKPPLQLSRDSLPPIDVLMVWHSYQLNPRAYLEDCLRYGKMQLWHTPMPWKAVTDAIDSETFVYAPGAEAEGIYQGLTGRSWENTADSEDKLVTCPTCKRSVNAMWASPLEIASKAYSDSTSLGAAIDKALSQATGFAARDFWEQCSCGTRLTHKRLNAGKFCADLEKLLAQDVPMGGTVLGLEGVPYKIAGADDVFMSEMTHKPNALLQADLGKLIVDGRQIEGKGSNESVEGIRELIELAITDKTYMRKARSSASYRMTRYERIAIRRMMSRYWDNSSPFALDLVGAVIRQSIFVEKMHNIDWLHSPALPSTMKRLLVKYERFVQIMADRTHMAVPTLDVDLAWHTHQLSPYGYINYTVKATKRFIDHDDKVAETQLNDSFAWTSKTYQRLFNEPYSACVCWYCEAVRESHTSTTSRLFKTSNARANDMLHPVEQDPRKSVHISAHNAVRPADDTMKYEINAKKKADELEKAYQKACERSRKKGKKEPKRDDYYYSDAWGYPVYIPAYSPYVGYVPYAPMYYGVSPGCMAVGAGMVGNCCNGTCGGGVAAGGCGESSEYRSWLLGLVLTVVLLN